MSAARAPLRIASIALLAGGLMACTLNSRMPEVSQPATPPLILTPVSYEALPGWSGNDPSAALSAFRRSCAVLMARPDAASMGGSGYAGTVGDWRPACAALPVQPQSASLVRAWFEHWFAPAQIRAGEAKDGLFTGYYEPDIAVSRIRGGAYQVPVYALPSDLIRADLSAFNAKWAHETLIGRLEGHELVPYPARAEIDAKGLPAAKVLFWADDPIAMFFLQIQGSGRARLSDGGSVRLAYAGQNGRPYTAIGRTLIQMGAIAKEQVSLQSIEGWLAAHPDQARSVMESDASFVFFREVPLADPAVGAEGSEGVNLTPEASLAVDASLHPLGVPLFLAAPVPDGNGTLRDFHRLLIAQDTGGAIRGAVRGDVYWGFGPDAAAIAGRMKSHGELYVLLPKTVIARWKGVFVAPPAVP